MADMMLAPGPLPPSLVEQIVRKVKETVVELNKSEVTGIKAEVNGLAAALNAAKIEWTAVKLEPPPAFDLWKKLEERELRGKEQLPEQIKKRADSAHDLATQAKQAAATANQSIAKAQTTAQAKAWDDAVRNKVNVESRAINNRITAVRAELFAHIGKQKSATGTDAAKLRREGDLTRKAVRDLTNAMRGTGPQSAQFKRQLDQIAQSLR